jgi:hypothetical protein
MVVTCEITELLSRARDLIRVKIVYALRDFDKLLWQMAQEIEAFIRVRKQAWEQDVFFL